jgi:hypothetical protein
MFDVPATLLSVFHRSPHVSLSVALKYVIALTDRERKGRPFLEVTKEAIKNGRNKENSFLQQQ